MPRSRKIINFCYCYWWCNFNVVASAIVLDVVVVDDDVVVIVQDDVVVDDDVVVVFSKNVLYVQKDWITL